VFIADRILQGSPEQVRDHLRALLPASTRQASRTPWGLRVSRTTTPCSPGLTAAYAPLLRTFTKAGGQPQARREPTIQPRRWGPEHIPAFLPKDWYDRHVEPLAGVNPMFTRRTAALRLVQMVAGGSLGEAAGYLGIAATDITDERKGRIYSGAGHVHRNARNQHDPHAFDSALHALAAELDRPTTRLIDYQKRRRALQAWAIDQPTWEDLISRLPPVPGPQLPELGERKRQIASIYVWVQVTFGEHHFAPRPIEAAQPHEVQTPGNNAAAPSGTYSKEIKSDPTTPDSRRSSTPSPPPSPERWTRRAEPPAANKSWEPPSIAGDRRWRASQFANYRSQTRQLASAVSATRGRT
jgi:hypothetical protein